MADALPELDFDAPVPGLPAPRYELFTTVRHLSHLIESSCGGGPEVKLDALSDLVAMYEDEHRPIEPASDADMLRHLLEAKGVTQAQLSKATGLAKSSLSEVLAGKKPFSRQMIRKLANYFIVDVSVLAANL